ncbi:hypothetical protein ASPZODRAFT_61985 [Penicilliopsis zonata CBS 506.65]|uniref:CN hydrolase domain-containing protein n=1 Tax=Penicilliopsis zonata CBS 506.65 TaxID=1073090 RepID=A0A1L9SMD2_9EURO|nr:hypothetical protein ASPZODRAFT_61985 [Penicilliopsis zonata CBS 506.65]OJJ48273.1 hypothetical protein ASPZODRAFT_61985 [Penicilliopsis zonata CBS 506.65]
MRIATLQFSPALGDLEGNISRANALLERDRGKLERLDVLVLPELAFTGYNFPSKEAIRPYLEGEGQGRTAEWAKETARRLGCKVCVGYAEIADGEGDGNRERCYNSLLVVDEEGRVVWNYRKAFLYYTDETWACEGEVVARGSHVLDFRARGGGPEETKQITTAFGICMDINPYKFEAPFTAWEFANRVLAAQAPLVILSMAWLTLASREELDALAGQPEMDTFQYWLRRFWPLVEQRMAHAESIVDHRDDAGAEDRPSKSVVLVFANRAGEEPAAAADKPPARYAGTSTVVAITQPNPTRSQGTTGAAVAPGDVKILCWDLMGATEEGVCFADTAAEPRMVFGLSG